MTIYPGTKLVGVAYKLRKKMKNSLSSVDVLHKTLNLVISRCCFAEDGIACVAGGFGGRESQAKTSGGAAGEKRQSRRCPRPISPRLRYSF